MHPDYTGDVQVHIIRERFVGNPEQWQFDKIRSLQLQFCIRTTKSRRQGFLSTLQKKKTYRTCVWFPRGSVTKLTLARFLTFTKSVHDVVFRCSDGAMVIELEKPLVQCSALTGLNNFFSSSTKPENYFFFKISTPRMKQRFFLLITFKSANEHLRSAINYSLHFRYSTQTCCPNLPFGI